VKRSISRPLIGLPSPSVPLSPEGTISCSICQAAYTPARLHAYLLQAPPIALESAFLSMCQFCFRCRRPSCPNCWDATHSICGQCADETHVPFRLPTPPLEGTTPLSNDTDFPADAYPLPYSLVPIHPGRFQEASPTNSMPGSSTQTHSPTRSAGTVVTSSSIDIDAIITRPDGGRSLDIDAIATRPDRGIVSDVEEVATRPDRSRSLDIDAIATRPDRGRQINKITTRPEHLASGRQRLFRALLICVLLVVILLLAIIVASLLVADVNLYVYNLLHIDIRAEFTTLWHFLRTLF
jgi:hypothetical protein